MVQIPTTQQLYESIKADIESTFGNNIPTIGKVFLNVMAKVQAGKLRIFYLFIAKLEKNIFVDTADPEANGGTLERYGRVKLNRNPFQAVAGQYTLTVTGSVGATIPSGTVFKSNDDSVNPGMLFILDTNYVLPGSSGTITVHALEAGTTSKMNVTEGMTSTAPIPLVSKSTVVASEVISPLDTESVEDYRSTATSAYRLEPQGGASSDFRLWSLNANGVRQSYPYATSGQSAEVDLYIEAIPADSTDGKGTPSGSLLTAVSVVVENDPDTTKPNDERGRRPIGVFQVNYLAITPLDVIINIAGFAGVTVDQKATILSSLTSVISDVRPFVAAIDVLSEKNDILSINLIISTILAALPGSAFGAVTMTVNGSPSSSHTFINGDIPFLANITYS